jgi:hypothetical protein
LVGSSITLIGRPYCQNDVKRLVIFAFLFEAPLMSSNNKRSNSVHPLPIIQPQNPDRDPRGSNPGVCGSRVVKYPSSDSVLSTPPSTKLVWEIKNLKQKIESEKDKSESKFYEAMLRGKQSQLNLEKTYNR